MNTELTMTEYAHDADTSWTISKSNLTFGGKLVKRTLKVQAMNAPTVGQCFQGVMAVGHHAVQGVLEKRGRLR